MTFTSDDTLILAIATATDEVENSIAIQVIPPGTNLIKRFLPFQLMHCRRQHILANLTRLPITQYL